MKTRGIAQVTFLLDQMNRQLSRDKQCRRVSYSKQTIIPLNQNNALELELNDSLEHLQKKKIIFLRHAKEDDGNSVGQYRRLLRKI